MRRGGKGDGKQCGKKLPHCRAEARSLRGGAHQGRMAQRLHGVDRLTDFFSSSGIGHWLIVQGVR